MYTRTKDYAMYVAGEWATGESEASTPCKRPVRIRSLRSAPILWTISLGRFPPGVTTRSGAMALSPQRIGLSFGRPLDHLHKPATLARQITLSLTS